MEQGRQGCVPGTVQEEGGAYRGRKAAIKKRVEKTIPKTEDATPTDIEKEGGLIGLLDALDLAKIPENAVEKIAPEAIRTMGAKKCAKAFSARKIRKLKKAARALMNGPDLKEFNKDQIKALLGKKLGERLGAFVDVRMGHSAQLSGTELLENIVALLEKNANSTKRFKVTLVQDAAVVAVDDATSEDTISGRRRLADIQSRTPPGSRACA